MEKEKEFKFQAINKGLGFHPFADKKPYAPLSKKPAKEMGTGAVSGGAPRFSSSLPNMNQRSMNDRGMKEVKRMPGMGQNSTSPTTLRPQSPAVFPTTVSTRSQNPSFSRAHQISQISPKAEAQSKEKATTIAEPTYGIVYLLKRMFAYLFDSTLNISLCLSAFALTFWQLNIHPNQLMSADMIFVSALFLAVFNWALITAQEIAFNTSLGKRLFGLNLEGNVTAIFLRSFFFIISIAFAGLGLLWSLIDRKKRCWHDLIVELQPNEIAKL
jgi:hypothetical protein